MTHPIYRVLSFSIIAPYTLEIRFDDQSSKIIDFKPVLKGELFGPLQNLSLFEKVALDPETNTLIWPNGADFDPATLHDWPEHAEEINAASAAWAFGETTKS